MLRGSFLPQTENLRSLRKDPVCQELEVVAACEGTSASELFTGKFVPVSEEDCTGTFEDGLPIYKNVGRAIYIYPIGYYSDTYSLKDYRGLVRWRISSYKHVDDKTCRRTDANIYNVDFAANGQPYNHHPIISCFDESGNDAAGWMTSRITIICRDDLNIADDDLASDTNKSNGVSLALAITFGVILLGGLLYLYWKRSKEKKVGNKAHYDTQHKNAAKRSNSNSTELVEDSPSKPTKSQSKRNLLSEDYVPKSIRNMVDYIENVLEREEKKKEDRTWINPVTSSTASKQCSSRPSRSRSLEPERAKAQMKNNRSRSLERSGASSFANRSDSRGRSRGRSVEQSRGRSRSAVRTMELDEEYLNKLAKINPYGDDMPVVLNQRERSRSRSLERSKARQHAEKQAVQLNQSLPSKSEHRGRSRSRTSHIPRERSLSLENSRANDFANKKAHRKSFPHHVGSLNIDRSTESENTRGRAQEPQGRLQSRGRSRDVRAPSQDRSRGRSLSLERSNANSFAQKTRQSKKISTKVPDLGTTVTKNSDGSVLVAQKRVREDGAIVTTKTKYVSIALARKHGVKI